MKDQILDWRLAEPKPGSPDVLFAMGASRKIYSIYQSTRTGLFVLIFVLSKRPDTKHETLDAAKEEAEDVELMMQEEQA